MTKSFTMVAWLTGLIMSSGCFVDIDPDSEHDFDDGLSVQWSVDGSTRPRACEDSGLGYARITVEDSDGVKASATVACDEFGHDFDLPHDNYWVTIQWLDGSHEEVASEIEFAGHVEVIALDVSHHDLNPHASDDPEQTADDSEPQDSAGDEDCG